MAKALYNNSPAWSDDERKVLAEMFYAGYPDEEIAHKLHRSAFAVGRQRAKLGLPKWKQPQPAEKFEIHDAMAEYYPQWYKDKLQKEWREKQTFTR